MNKYVKSFFHRGLVFGGFGPLVMAVVYLVLAHTVDNFSINGTEAFTAIFTVYLLAFVHAGASVFNQIEEWSLVRALAVHLSTLYAAYVTCYLINSWIPFDIKFLLVFTACFLALYFIIWLTVYFAVKATQKRLNARLK